MCTWGRGCAYMCERTLCVCVCVCVRVCAHGGGGLIEVTPLENMFANLQTFSGCVLPMSHESNTSWRLRDSVFALCVCLLHSLAVYRSCLNTFPLLTPLPSSLSRSLSFSPFSVTHTQPHTHAHTHTHVQSLLFSLKSHASSTLPHSTLLFPFSGSSPLLHPFTPLLLLLPCHAAIPLSRSQPHYSRPAQYIPAVQCIPVQ